MSRRRFPFHRLLATGTTTGKYFMLHFVDVGGTFYEVSPTAAM
ncbi:MAG: hypothetical protein ABSA09_00860 [Desulfobaccales bacterium]|jgi:hypothetical protein